MEILAGLGMTFLALIAFAILIAFCSWAKDTHDRHWKFFHPYKTLKNFEAEFKGTMRRKDEIHASTQQRLSQQYAESQRWYQAYQQECVTTNCRDSKIIQLQSELKKATQYCADWSKEYHLQQGFIRDLQQQIQELEAKLKKESKRGHHKKA